MSEPLNWLRSFEAAARRGTLTLAASEVCLTQAAVSQQIKALESRLGVQLFQREPRGVSLTGAGTELYTEVSKGLKYLDSALDRFVQTDKSELYVVCNTSLATRWLLPLLSSFGLAYPEISLRFKTALWRMDTIGINADIEIYLDDGRGGGNKIPISDGEFIATASPQYSEKKNKRYIAVSGMKELSPPIDKEKPTLEVDSFHAALCFAEAGIGAVICPKLLAKDAIATGQLIELENPLKTRKASYQCQIMNQPNTASQLFKEWLVTQVDK